jgi:hypothetical protein
MLRCRHGDRLIVLYGRAVAPLRLPRAAPSCDRPYDGHVQAMSRTIAMYWHIAAAQT